MSQYIAVAKLAYVPLVNSDDEVVPGNIGALRHGLEALKKEDAGDYVRAQQLWQLAKELLVEESEDELGAGAQGTVERSDDFMMELIGEGI